MGLAQIGGDPEKSSDLARVIPDAGRHQGDREAGAIPSHIGPFLGFRAVQSRDGCENFKSLDRAPEFCAEFPATIDHLRCEMDDRGCVEANDLLRIIADHIACALIEEGDDSLRVGCDDRDLIGGFQNICQFLMLLGERLLRIDSCGDVLLHRDITGKPSLLIHYRGDGGLLPEERAILAFIMETSFPCLAIRDRSPKIGVKLLALLSRGDEIWVFSKGFLMGVAGQLFKGRIHILDHSLAVSDHDYAVALLDGDTETLEFFLISAKFRDITLHRHESNQHSTAVHPGDDFQFDQIHSPFLGIIQDFLLDSQAVIEGLPNTEYSLWISFGPLKQ